MRGIRTRFGALGALVLLMVAGGCASPVPGGVTGATGKVLKVTITTYGIMYPQYYYYFVINHVGATGDPNGPGAPHWTPYDPARDNYLAFGGGFPEGAGWRVAEAEFIERVYRDKRLHRFFRGP